jgi:tetratricopeptide (TPR) repeat protein
MNGLLVLGAVVLVAVAGLLIRRSFFDAATILASSKRALAEGRAEKAESRLNRVVRLLKDREGGEGHARILGEAYVALGRIHRKGRTPQAVKEFQEAFKRVPLDPPDLGFLAGELARAKDLSTSAVRAYAAVLRRPAGRRSPEEQAAAGSARALAEVDGRRPPGDVASLQRLNAALREADPSLPWPARNLGILALWHDQIDQACSLLEAALSAGPEEPEAAAWVALARGTAARARKALPEAEELLGRAAAALPACPLARAGFGLALLDRSREAGAADVPSRARSLRFLLQGIAHLEEACRLHGGNAGWREALGSALLDLPAPRRALAAFEHVLRVDPGRITAALGRARALRAEGRAAEALEAVGKISLDGSVPAVALLLKGELLLELGRAAEAAEAFEVAAAQPSPDALVYLGWAKALFAMGRFSEILGDLRSHLTGSLEARLLVARAEAASGHGEAAQRDFDLLRRDFRDLLEQGGGWAVEHYQGCALARAGDWEQAEAFFQRAVVVDKYRPETYRQRAICRAKLGELSGAREDLKSSLALDPRNSDGHYLMGILLASLDPAAAAAHLREAADLDPGHVPARAGLARLAEATGDGAGARFLLEENVKLTGGDSEAVGDLGCLLTRLGEDAAAVETLQQASDGPGAGVLRRYHLGLSLARLGRHEEAVSVWGPLAEPSALPQSTLSHLLHQIACAHYLAARERLSKGDLAGATEHLRSYLKVYGDDAATARRLADILSAMAARALADAEEPAWEALDRHLAEASHLDPESPSPPYCQAIASYRRGDLEAARQALAALGCGRVRASGAEEAGRGRAGEGAHAPAPDGAAPPERTVRLLEALVALNGRDAGSGLATLEALKGADDAAGRAARLALARWRIRTGDFAAAADELVALARAGGTS